MIEGLCSYAEAQLELNEAQSDGSTLRDHLAVVARQTGKMPAEFVEAECPPELAYLWEHFAWLCGKRESDGMGGVSPIRYADMMAYCQAQRLSPFEIWEVAVLDRLDVLWRKLHNARMKKQTEQKASYVR